MLLSAALPLIFAISAITGYAELANPGINQKINTLVGVPLCLAFAVIIVLSAMKLFKSAKYLPLELFFLVKKENREEAEALSFFTTLKSKREKTDPPEDFVLLPVLEGDLEDLRESLADEERFLEAIIASIIVTAFSVVAWGTALGFTESNILSWLPLLGVGYTVGSVISVVGRGVTFKFRALSVLATLIGCLIIHTLIFDFRLESLGFSSITSTYYIEPWILLKQLLHNMGPAQILSIAFSLAQAYYLSMRSVGAEDYGVLFQGREHA